MKVLIQSAVALTGIRDEYIEEFRDFLTRNGVPYRFYGEGLNEKTGLSTWGVRLNYDLDPTVCVNLSEEDMKIFLNTVERHSRKRIQFEYLGNMRFDLILGN